MIALNQNNLVRWYVPSYSDDRIRNFFASDKYEPHSYCLFKYGESYSFYINFDEDSDFELMNPVLNYVDINNFSVLGSEQATIIRINDERPFHYWVFFTYGVINRRFFRFGLSDNSGPILVVSNPMASNMEMPSNWLAYWDNRPVGNFMYDLGPYFTKLRLQLSRTEMNYENDAKQYRNASNERYVRNVHYYADKYYSVETQYMNDRDHDAMKEVFRHENIIIENEKVITKTPYETIPNRGSYIAKGEAEVWAGERFDMNNELPNFECKAEWSGEMVCQQELEPCQAEWTAFKCQAVPRNGYFPIYTADDFANWNAGPALLMNDIDFNNYSGGDIIKGTMTDQVNMSLFGQGFQIKDINNVHFQVNPRDVIFNGFELSDKYLLKCGAAVNCRFIGGILNNTIAGTSIGIIEPLDPDNLTNSGNFDLCVIDNVRVNLTAGHCKLLQGNAHAPIRVKNLNIEGTTLEESCIIYGNSFYYPAIFDFNCTTPFTSIFSSANNTPFGFGALYLVNGSMQQITKYIFRDIYDIGEHGRSYRSSSVILPNGYIPLVTPWDLAFSPDGVQVATETMQDRNYWQELINNSITTIPNPLGGDIIELAYGFTDEWEEYPTIVFPFTKISLNTNGDAYATVLRIGVHPDEFRIPVIDYINSEYPSITLGQWLEFEHDYINARGLALVNANKGSCSSIAVLNNIIDEGACEVGTSYIDLSTRITNNEAFLIADTTTPPASQLAININYTVITDAGQFDGNDNIFMNVGEINAFSLIDTSMFPGTLQSVIINSAVVEPQDDGTYHYILRY